MASTGTSGGLPRFPNLTDNNRDVFHWSMTALDAHASLPLFWGSAKSSAWYSVGLLARGRNKDIHLALQYLDNILTQQYTEEGDVTYGTFKNDFMSPWAQTGSLVEPKIYDTYDPNNALFVTIAFIIIDAHFAGMIPAALLGRIRNSMFIAVKGDEERVGGRNGDNLRPCYTNPWYMRMVCAAYVGFIRGDAGMVGRSEGYLNDAMDLFDRHQTISEYNSPTYLGITLLALGLAQYLPAASRIRRRSSALITEIWREVGLTYNASLTNLSGAWDRTYGYDMTMYVSGLGAAITNIIGMKGRFPLPDPLASSLHIEDAAGIPITCLVAPYLEEHLPLATRLAFTELQPHSHNAKAFSPPFDVQSRLYSYYVGDGYSVGGIEFDECEAGGPSLNQESFSPGVVMWNTGTEGTGVGWISYVPTSACCSIIATASSLTIRYPPSLHFPNRPRCTVMRLHLSTFSDLQLSHNAFSSAATAVVSLPGMDIRLSGNVAEFVQPKLRYASGSMMHGLQYYVLEYELPHTMLKNENVPELVVGLEKVSLKPRLALS